ncbi:hypothetical protein KUTeg_017106 [Tegillarca granosa]|uniref:Tetraspanin n=1 Tax=Tegillarca granosa TaxID=220873 RepID=A0ABQ9EMU4_TEGGR|nr:hypothetical protein KUTeg_017106 [Tegillarca granosa]
MTMGRTKTFLKSGLLVFNVLVFFVGALILSLGIYILVSAYGAKELSSIMGLELYHVVAYVSIGSGAAISVLSLCGCCGSIKQSRCVLAIYLMFMVIILILLIAAAVFVFVFLGQLKCCGVSGGVDSTDSWAIYKLSTKWYKRFPLGKPYVPDSCCKPDGDLGLCTGMLRLNGPPTLGPSSNTTLVANPHLYVNTFGLAFGVCFCRILGQRRYRS